MNRSLAIAAFAAVLIAATQARADGTQVGLTLDYNEVMLFYDDAGQQLTDHYDAVGASAVVDSEYVRFMGGYATNVGDYIRFADGGEQHDDRYRIRYLNATALGKVPFRFAQERLVLWPALGLRGAYNLRYSHGGTSEVNQEPHDLWVVGGAGLDYVLSPRFALTSALLATYDLTPGMGAYASDPQAISLGLSLGGLLRL